MGHLRDGLIFWRTMVILLTPLLLLPLPLAAPSSESKCAYGLIIMAVYWITEAIPIPVTSLLPVVIFPLLGIISSGDLCKNYLKDTSMLFVGGLMVAVAIESSNLHKRVALSVLRIVGSNPRFLQLGFMIPTWFLSMWISNTATTAMMIPVTQAVLEQLGKKHKDNTSSGHLNAGFEPTNSGLIDSDTCVEKIQMNVADEMSQSQEDTHRKNENEEGTLAKSSRVEMEEAEDTQYQDTCKCLSLCVAYAANIGGTATLTGTGPNLVLKGLTDTLFRQHNLDSAVNFTSWMIYGLPAAFICLVCAWLWLQIIFFGCRCNREHDADRDQRVKAVIKGEYAALGPMTFAEKVVLCLFTLLALLWILREPEFFPGWGSLLPNKSYVTDATPAVFVAILLFTIPFKKPHIFCWRPRSDSVVSQPALLEWQPAEHKFPWGIVLLLGGGFALADACEKSGLSQLIGEKLIVFNGIPPWALQIIITLLVAALTEVTSNTATATILLPIMAKLAEGIGMNPLYLMLPTTLACSYAFMLPVATPPNAIAFSYGHLRVVDMAKTGLVLNLVCVLVATLATQTWGMAYFRLNQLPWEDMANLTTVSPQNFTAELTGTTIRTFNI